MNRVLVLMLLLSASFDPQASPSALAEEEIPLNLSNGRTMTALLRRPSNVDGPLPVIMLFGGFRSAAKVLDLIDADLPVIRTSFRYPWQAPKELGVRNALPIVDSFGVAVDDTIEGIELLVRHLRGRTDVDPKRIVIVGASAGAPFATIGGARSDLPAIVIIQGFGAVASVIARQFNLKLEQDHGPWIRYPSSALARFIVWYLGLPKPEDHARQFGSEQQVLMITANEDERVPSRATEVLWEAIKASEAPSQRMDLPGRHLRGASDDRISLLLQRVIAWMRESDLL